MRFVIFGAGAIGGAVGARLSQAGNDVMLIARGAHHDAIARSGLTLETPEERTTLSIPVAERAADVAWHGSDVVLLATKSQDSADALLALRDAAPDGLPVVCVQNGVVNERLALRLFSDVYGAVVMVPAAHLEPGVVQSYGTTLTGMIDIGRYPRGLDTCCRTLSQALAGARFSSAPREDVMRFKYAKLIANLANAANAICGEDGDPEELIDRAREEGRAVLRAAGIEFGAEEVDDVGGRWQRMGVRDIDGRKRAGSSTWQSLIRGTGAVETDYLNGEIVLLARMHGAQAPVNERLQALAREMARNGLQPGWLSPEDVLAGAL